MLSPDDELNGQQRNPRQLINCEKLKLRKKQQQQQLQHTSVCVCVRRVERDVVERQSGLG